MVMVTAHSRVEDLVPGDLSAITAARDMLGAGIAPAQDAAAILTGLQVQGWKGVSADRFAQVAPREAQKGSVLPEVFSRSASAMARWESAFTAARTAASEAIQLAARAEALTAQARADYQTAALSAEVAAAAGTPQSQPVTFVDRGAAVNAQAEAALATALSTLNAVGTEVASAIRPTAGWPPSDPEDRNGWDKVLFFAPDLLGPGLVGGLVEIVAGVGESLWWTFETFDPFRFIVDQINGGQQWSDAWWANFASRFGEVGEGIGYVLANPLEVGGAILGDFFAVDLWENEPGTAFGRVLLNVALLATGVGGVIKGVKATLTAVKVARTGDVNDPGSPRYYPDPYGHGGEIPKPKGPMYQDGRAGTDDGWVRVPNENVSPGDYGFPQATHGDAPLWSREPGGATSSEIQRLILHGDAPFGWDENGNPIKTQAEWNSRYALPNDVDGNPVGVNWPGNGGAVNDSRVRYDNIEALLRDYPEFQNLDRIGGDRGDYLAVEGTPFEQRGLTPGHKAFDYNTYQLTGNLPDHIKPEVSIVAPANGFPGGGWQIRFWNERTEKWLSIDDMLKPKFGVLDES